MRKYIIAAILSIPFILSISAFRQLNAWYFYIPLAFIMFTNFLAISKIWLIQTQDLTKEDMRVSLQTGTILVLAKIAVSIFA